MIDILDLSDKVARTVLAGRHWHTPEDWEDAAQEAAVGIVEALKKPDKGEGYLFNAGRAQVYEWLRGWLRHPRSGTVWEYMGYGGEDATASSPLDLSPLKPALTFQRAQKVDEDVKYLELRLAGLSTAGIALEMGISERNVYAIRERLLPRLERIARGEGPPPMVWHVQESSRAALERVNKNPDMLRKRGEAIRAGLARKKAAACGG